MNPEKLKTIKSLKTLLGDSEQFVLTGSTVMEIQQLADKSTDIDIILENPTKAGIELLARLVKDAPANAFSVKGMEKGRYSFNYQATKVDVFIAPIDAVKYDACLNFDGITLSPVLRIVKAKQSFHRLKDLMQLKYWASKFYKAEEQEAELQKIAVTEDYN